MKPFDIFYAGKHTDSNGVDAEFVEAHLNAIAENYDPGVHEAPIVIGHPKANAPAWGWVEKVTNQGGTLVVTPKQVDAAFEEMVGAGRFKKRSASFYTPDSPNNPRPGAYYLRHVGFLGAQPPALKGLGPVELAEDTEGVVEFADVSLQLTQGTVARVFRRMREWIIDKFDTDQADQVIPEYMVADLEDQARAQDTSAQPTPAFSEPEGAPTMSDPKKDAAAEQAAADIKAREDAVAAKETSFTEREKALDAREAKARRDKNAAIVDALVKAGKLLPAERERELAFMDTLGTADVIEFADADGKPGKRSQLAEYRERLQARPAVVPLAEFSDLGADGNAPLPEGMSALELAEKAREYQEARRANGTIVSITQAVRSVREGRAA